MKYSRPLPSMVTSFGPDSGLPLYLSARISIFPVLRSVRVTRGIPPVAMPLRSAVGDAAPSAAISRPCGSMTRPLAMLLFSRKIENLPSLLKRMMRCIRMSVK